VSREVEEDEDPATVPVDLVVELQAVALERPDLVGGIRVTGR
jgi:hypothetical protein